MNRIGPPPALAMTSSVAELASPDQAQAFGQPFRTEIYRLENRITMSDRYVYEWTETR